MAVETDEIAALRVEIEQLQRNLVIPRDITIGSTPLKAGASWGLLQTAVNAYNQYADRDKLELEAFKADIEAGRLVRLGCPADS